MKNSLIDLFERSVARFSDNTFLLEKRSDRFEPTTYRQVQAHAIEIGAGLASLGIAKGDNVSILAEGCNDWIISELGIFYAAGVSVPLSIKLEESNDLFFRLQHCALRSAVAVPQDRRHSRQAAGPAPRHTFRAREGDA